MSRLSATEEQRRLAIIVEENGNWSQSARRIGIHPSGLADFLSSRRLRTLADIRARLAQGTIA